jgi:hypothetical protein
MTHAENDEDKRAIACLERAVDQDPHSLPALLALGVSYVNELDSVRALQNLKAWVEHNPKYQVSPCPPSLPPSLDPSFQPFCQPLLGSAQPCDRDRVVIEEPASPHISRILPLPPSLPPFPPRRAWRSAWTSTATAPSWTR